MIAHTAPAMPTRAHTCMLLHISELSLPRSFEPLTLGKLLLPLVFRCRPPLDVVPGPPAAACTEAAAAGDGGRREKGPCQLVRQPQPLISRHFVPVAQAVQVHACIQVWRDRYDGSKVHTYIQKQGTS